MRRSRVVFGAALLIACVGCSNPRLHHAGAPPASSTSDEAAVRSAAQATRGSSARIDEKIEVSGSGTTFDIAVAGSFDMAGDKGQLAVDFPPGAISHIDEIFAGSNVYLRGLSGFEQRWVSTSRDRAESHYLLRAPLNDPEYVLQQVAAMGKVSKVRVETVNGTSATHYRGTLDNAALTFRMAAHTQKEVAAMRESLGGDLPAFADTWIDKTGRVVRTVLSLNVAQESATVTMNLSDVGTPVKAVAPSDSVPAGSAVIGVLPG